MSEDIQHLRLVRDRLETASLNPVYDDLARETGIYDTSEPEPVFHVPESSLTSISSIRKFVRYALEDLADFDSVNH